MTVTPKQRLDHGNLFPFDAPDEWWNGSEPLRPHPGGDWAVRAARGVIADLQDRRGIKHELEDLDEDVRKNIVESLASIIRVAREDACST